MKNLNFKYCPKTEVYVNSDGRVKFANFETNTLDDLVLIKSENGYVVQNPYNKFKERDLIDLLGRLFVMKKPTKYFKFYPKDGDYYNLKLDNIEMQPMPF